uniref:EF-hand domain-containing protein n=1 Tax=Parascaris univalens TaxID=6257 RepID=A0A915AC87_PARUN
MKVYNEEKLTKVDEEIDLRTVVDDIETVRMKLTEFVMSGFDDYETEGRRRLHEERLSSRKSASSTSEDVPPIVEDDAEAISQHSQFNFQVRRRAFLLMANDEKRTLEYRFTLVKAEKVVIELELLISNDQPGERTYINDVFVVLSDINNEQVIAVTKKVTNKKYFTEECILQPGQYSLTFHTCGCIPDAKETDQKRVQLIDENGKLSKPFRVTLMNIFDMFDFDENGTLNRAEFDVFNVVGSDEHVSDQEWSVLLDNFQSRNGELTMSSLIALHQVEAKNNSDLEEIWISLKCIGYNSQLLLDMNCPCAFTIRSQEEINLQTVDFRVFSAEEEQMLNDYFWDTGTDYYVNDDLNIRLWKSEYFAACIAGSMVELIPYLSNGHTHHLTPKNLSKSKGTVWLRKKPG